MGSRGWLETPRLGARKQRAPVSSAGLSPGTLTLRPAPAPVSPDPVPRSSILLQHQASCPGLPAPCPTAQTQYPGPAPQILPQHPAATSHILLRLPSPAPSSLHPVPSQFPAPAPRASILHPASGSQPWHPVPGSAEAWCCGCPRCPPSSPPCLLFQVQDFGLKHLLGMSSLRLLSLAGETLTLLHTTPRGWGGTGHGGRESPGDSLGTASSPPSQQAAAPSPACGERATAGLSGCCGFWGGGALGAMFLGFKFFGVLVFEELFLGALFFGVLFFGMLGF